jgi:hypothetical protein
MRGPFGRSSPKEQAVKDAARVTRAKRVKVVMIFFP